MVDLPEPYSQFTVIGRREYVKLPEWGIGAIRAKIDTGARTSAIHATNIQPIDDGKRVRFTIITSRKENARHIDLVAEIVRQANVRSSSGKQQNRYVVATRMRLGRVDRIIELSLADREEMLCPMLLGRRSLAGEFLVDVSRAYVLRTRKTKKKRE